ERSVVQGGNNCGGIAGSAAGTIENCHFSGSVFGSQKVGGVAGTSQANICNSRNHGILFGQQTVGAIAGGNTGVVGNCFNSGAIYNEAQAAQFSLMAVEEPMALMSLRSSAFDITQYYGNIAGEGEIQNSYDAAVFTGSSEELLSALNAGAEENSAYTNWTKASAANKGLPYYAAFSGGDGTEANPYRITTIEQLAWLGTLVNEGNDQSGILYQLDADLVLNEGSFVLSSETVQWLDGTGKPRDTAETPVEWIPIGSTATPFAGTLDGNGHTLSGLYCPGETGGLFGNLSGTVKNLLLADGYFANGNNAVAGSGSGTVIHCGSTSAGIGAVLPGETCWDMLSNLPVKADLNATAEHPWHEVPGSDELSFLPTFLPIHYEGGSFENCIEYYVFGEPIISLTEPVRAGAVFAGWNSYENEQSLPTAQFFTDPQGLDITHTQNLFLVANWAEEGNKLQDYCTYIDGTYALTQDVTLAETITLTEDCVLDLNGFTLQGHGDKALLYAEGCMLTLKNSVAETGGILTNAAAAGGLGGQILVPGSTTDITKPEITISSDEEVFTLAIFTPAEGSSGTGYLAKYNNQGKMVSVEKIAEEKTMITKVISAQEIADSFLIRGFLIPDSWLR
ncbi:MAG: hypothetical protein IJO79_06130, partial [Firmicutes bacterium]|nr:hypothetical protein [Bacillota bacterium]